MAVPSRSAAARIDEARRRRNDADRPAPMASLTVGRRRPMRPALAATARAQVAELVDALASGASGLTAVKVRVLSWAPFAHAHDIAKVRAGWSAASLTRAPG